MARGKSSAAGVRSKSLRSSPKPKIKRMTGGGGLEYLGNRSSVSGARKTQAKKARAKKAKAKRKRY